MSLLLAEAEKRFEARLQLAEKEAQAEQRQLEAKANIMEMELRAFTTKALQEAQLAVCIAERRTAEALAAAAAAEEQAEKQRLQHQVEKQKFEELLQQERRDKEAQLLDFERLLHLEHSDAQRRVRLMQEQMAELQAETTRRVSECQRFTSSLQLQSERQVKRAEAQADAKTQALHEQQLRQLQELQELLESCQAEAAERVETTQLEAEIRVDLATRRGLAAAERGATAAQQHWALSQAQAWRHSPLDAHQSAGWNSDRTVEHVVWTVSPPDRMLRHPGLPEAPAPLPMSLLSPRTTLPALVLQAPGPGGLPDNYLRIWLEVSLPNASGIQQAWKRRILSKERCLFLELPIARSFQVLDHIEDCAGKSHGVHKVLQQRPLPKPSAP
eukprot:g31760.t1